MAEGQGLLTKESIQRTVKSKWFLPALGVGGAVVVLLIVANRRKGGSASADEFIPEETYQEAPLGSSGSSDDFSSLADDIMNQNQQNQDLLASQIDAQNSFIESAISDIYGQLGNFGSTVDYGDPYAGMYADDGYQYTDPVYSNYGYDDIGDVMTPVLEDSVAFVGKREPDNKNVLQPTNSDLRDSSGGKVSSPTPTPITPVKSVSTPAPVKITSPTPVSKPSTPGVQAPGGTGVRTPAPSTPAKTVAPAVKTPAPATKTTNTTKKVATK